MLANETLFLRAPEPEDLDQFYKWENDTALWQYGATIAPFSKYTLKEYIATGGGDFFQVKQLRLMVVLKEQEQTVGMVDLFDFDPFHRRAAIGILIDPEFQQKGLGKIVLDLIDEYAFRFLGIHMLYAHIPLLNHASIKLFEKAAYGQQGILNDWIRIGDQYHDVLILQKIKASSK